MSTLHVVPHTHWDREWYRPFEPMRVRLVHLIDRLLGILAREPHFRHFTLDGQTIVVDDYLAIRPERAEEIRDHVKRGRLLVGPWTVLPDEFLVSPEALVRNLLHGTRRSAELGGRMEVAYVPDPFGHVGQLPQILRGHGLASAALRRGLGEEPTELLWEAPDGSRVLLAYLRDGYDNAARLPEDVEGFAAVVRKRRDSLAPHSLVSHRLLMAGSDHEEPADTLAARVASTRLEEDELRISTLPAYVAAVQEELAARGIEPPVVRGELRDPQRHHLLPGVLSSRVWIKQRNHACETLLERWAEPFSAWAETLCANGSDRPAITGHVATPRVRGAAGLLREAWRVLLTCQPHDSICGCSIDAVHDAMQTRFDAVEQIAEEVIGPALAALANRVASHGLRELGAHAALVVFNPHARTRSDLARAQLRLGPALEPFEIVDSEGHPAPYRILAREPRPLAELELSPADLRAWTRRLQRGRILGLSLQSVGIRRAEGRTRVEVMVSEDGEPDHAVVQKGLTGVERLLAGPDPGPIRLSVHLGTQAVLDVRVADLPPHGLRTFALRPARRAPRRPRRDRRASIANEWLCVTTAADGTLTLEELRSGLRFPGLLRLEDRADRGDSYNFCALEGDLPRTPVRPPVRLRRERDGCGEALELTLRLRVPAGLSADRRRRSSRHVTLPARARLALVPGARRLDVTLEIENRARDHRLQAVFPLGFPVGQAAYDGHFEIVRRATALPRDTAGWVEQPVPEVPMRAFVAGLDDAGRGLLVAARGLRETSVSPKGDIAVTLLRSFGWLSRDDLASRRGGAGPSLETPGGQSLGPHRFELALIPVTGDLLEAAHEAWAFQTPPRAVGTELHEGRLAPELSLLSIEPEALVLSALKQSETGEALIVRLVNSTARRVPGRLRLGVRLASAQRTRIDESPLEMLPVGADGFEVALEAGPHEIVSVRLEPVR